MAVPFIGKALQFFSYDAVSRVFLVAKKDDGLGDQQNRKKLAARAFLEGYEPDSRLFAKGPVDDAPDVVIPEPLTEPVTNILPPQSPVVPQLVPALLLWLLVKRIGLSYKNSIELIQILLLLPRQCKRMRNLIRNIERV